MKNINLLALGLLNSCSVTIAGFFPFVMPAFYIDDSGIAKIGILFIQYQREDEYDH